MYTSHMQHICPASFTSDSTSRSKAIQIQEPGSATAFRSPAFKSPIFQVFNLEYVSGLYPEATSAAVAANQFHALDLNVSRKLTSSGLHFETAQSHFSFLGIWLIVTHSESDFAAYGF